MHANSTDKTKQTQGNNKAGLPQTNGAVIKVLDTLYTKQHKFEELISTQLELNGLPTDPDSIQDTLSNWILKFLQYNENSYKKIGELKNPEKFIERSLTSYIIILSNEHKKSLLVKPIGNINPNYPCLLQSEQLQKVEDKVAEPIYDRILSILKDIEQKALENRNDTMIKRLKAFYACVINGESTKEVARSLNVQPRLVLKYVHELKVQIKRQYNMQYRPKQPNL